MARSARFELTSTPGSAYARVSSEGKTIEIDAAQTDPKRDITGRWSFQAKRR